MYSSHSLLIMEGLRKKNVETEKVDFFFFSLKNVSSCGKYCIFTSQFQRVSILSWQLWPVSPEVAVVSGSWELCGANTSGSHFEEQGCRGLNVLGAPERQRSVDTQQHTCSLCFSFPGGLGWTREQALDDSTKAPTTNCFPGSLKCLPQTNLLLIGARRGVGRSGTNHLQVLSAALAPSWAWEQLRLNPAQKKSPSVCTTASTDPPGPLPPSTPGTRNPRILVYSWWVCASEAAAERAPTAGNTPALSQRRASQPRAARASGHWF